MICAKKELPDNTVPPTWMIWAGSAVIAVHLLMVVIGAAAAASGPWPETGMVGPPQLAISLYDNFAQEYLQCVKMTHNYHFATNRPHIPGNSFEVRLKDKEGREIATVQFPEDNANPWVRHRQELLALWLADDQAVQLRMGEKVAAPNQEPPAVQYWEEQRREKAYEPLVRTLQTKPEHLVDRERGMPLRPSERSLILARSYLRFLCRKHGAASAEMSWRYYRPLSSNDGSNPDIPDSAIDLTINHFGELPR